jgi:hypothetical protein
MGDLLRGKQPVVKGDILKRSLPVSVLVTDEKRVDGGLSEIDGKWLVSQVFTVFKEKGLSAVKVEEKMERLAVF